MLCVIGCGNSTRSDDGVGVFVAQTLKRQLAEHPNDAVQVFDAGTGGMDVMFQARGADRLIIVDAARSGSEPGAIFKVPGDELESEPELRFSLHEFRWQHALAAGRKLFGANFPKDVTVYLIEASTVEFGLELGASVRAAALRVVDEIEADIEATPRRPADAASPSLIAARGNFYLSRELCDIHLSGIVSVALILRAGVVYIVPLTRDSAGGLLLKQRNARGDRVIHAQEFIREKGLPEVFEPRSLGVRWDPGLAALAIDGL